jgi:repressor of nif and glnA expression
MSKFAALRAGNIRYGILQILEADIEYSQNAFLIQAALEDLGYKVSAEEIEFHLDWLAAPENGLVTLQRNPVLNARLTNRGEDVVLLRLRVNGVSRPRVE